MEQVVREFGKRIEIIEFVASVDTADLPTDLVELIDWMESKIDLIPFSHREAAKCRFEIKYDYTGNTPSSKLNIYYYRPENSEEMEKRILQEKNLEQRNRQREMALLQELEAKYRLKNK